MTACTYGAAEGEGIRCHRPAELLHEIPGRAPLTMYPVCLPHAEVLDRFFKLFPELVRSQELRYQAAQLIKEAERVLDESQDLRSDRPGDQSWRTD